MLAIVIACSQLAYFRFAAAQEPQQPKVDIDIDYSRAVRPILAKHCYACHGETKQKGGLRLDIKSEAFIGGESFGPAIVAGQADDSPLFDFVANPNADLKMPPEGEGLNPHEIMTLRAWIDGGADWPAGADTAKLIDRRDHWSFRPPVAASLPPTRDHAWPRQTIDHFVLAKLEAAGLTPSPEADRVAWLRRVSFDLTGLPPTADQIDDFINDSDPLAYDRVVDRLLASPHYGEHWGQHWLDVVRYADTHGFEVNTERPNAWPYRDYVIRAFNDDIPYDRFVREQIAGDLFDQPAATGFLVTASVLLPGQIGADEPSKRLARQDALDEIVVNIGQTFLGMSVACARCHDHKFDPISQRDYYALQSFVAGIEYGDRDLLTPEFVSRRESAKQLRQQLDAIARDLARFEPFANARVIRPAVDAKENVDRFAPILATRLRFTVTQTNRLEPCIDELEVFNVAGENVALATRGAKFTSSGDNVSPDRHELRLINDGRYGNSTSWMSNEMGGGWVTVEFLQPQRIDRVVWGRDREGQFKDRLAIGYRIEVAGPDGIWWQVADHADRQLTEEQKATAAEKLTAEQKPATALPKGATAATGQASPPHDALTDDERLAKAALTTRKAELEKAIVDAITPPKVFAGVPRPPDKIHVLSRGNPEQPKEPVTAAIPELFGRLDAKLDGADESQVRLALADWIVNPSNPLASRVIVNRIWQGHFGIGLVATSSDFGRSGLPPSHPELLDRLAADFAASGWSVKRLHREIVLSATYRQASSMRPEAAQVDADNRLLWRFTPRRLEAESIRDSILAISGRLNREMYGRGYDLFNQRGGLSGFTPIEAFQAEGSKRMIYAHKVRREREAVFGAFDCPDAGQSASRREESTTPIQALNLFNSRFTLDHSKAWADRIRAQAPDDTPRQVELTYREALGRTPDPAESSDAAQLVTAHGLDTLCRVLINCNEFLFVP